MQQRGGVPRAPSVGQAAFCSPQGQANPPTDSNPISHAGHRKGWDGVCEGGGGGAEKKKKKKNNNNNNNNDNNEKVERRRRGGRKTLSSGCRSAVSSTAGSSSRSSPDSAGAVPHKESEGRAKRGSLSVCVHCGLGGNVCSKQPVVWPSHPCCYRRGAYITERVT